MKQIKLHEASGKTIQGVAGNFKNRLITFTDGTFVHLGIHPGWDGDPGSIDDEDYKLGDSDVADEDCVKAGLYTSEECRQMYAEREQQRQQRDEASERAVYQRLRKKFEKPDSQG